MIRFDRFHATSSVITLVLALCAAPVPADTNKRAVGQISVQSKGSDLKQHALSGSSAGPREPFRPPAVPLVAHNPYFSIWSDADKLTDDTTRHWTTRPHPLSSLIRIDGVTYRLMGKEPAAIQPLAQLSLDVLPTRTIYRFGSSTLQVTLSFMTPAIPAELDVLARPVTYLSWSIRSMDGKPHHVSLFAGASAQIVVNSPEQVVDWRQSIRSNLSVGRMGTVDQTFLEPAGDDTRIDWGYLYVAAPSAGCRSAVLPFADMAAEFARTGTISVAAALSHPRPANQSDPTLGFAIDMGVVGANPVSRHILLAYDEVFAMEFLGKRLRPYWRRNGAGAGDLLADAERDYKSLIPKCESFDREMLADADRLGGPRYARIAALAYRQALAGCGWAADSNKQPLIFTKENSSNGCVATTDVFYPAAPQFLLMGATYAKALVAPVLVYSASPQWKFPFAPHDIGVYPQANAQVYGGGETPGNESDKMPVEESGNMILLCDAIAKMEGNAGFASRWWPQLTQWERYLEKYGLDPEDQLCTDDFMGHLAHNANLSVKAILAIAAYGDLCRLRGDAAASRRYFALARADAAHWVRAAADGDHTRIAFDKPKSWSQKYNLVWDRILGLNIFPLAVARGEVAYYKRIKLKFGVPLDSRTRLTKTDWSVWSATLAENQADFQAIVNPILDYLNATTARLPFVDSYVTDNRRSDGMRARPVIGGVFIRAIADPKTWKKWASRDTTRAESWALAPIPPSITEVIPTAQRQPAAWRFTISKPAAGWNQAGFDDGGWQDGLSGFGSRGTPGAVVNTEWTSPDIWIRRTVAIPSSASVANLQLLVYHDEDVEIYIDGVLAARRGGYNTSYQRTDISGAARKLIRPGSTITLAVHCHQTVGGQGVDVGFVEVTNR